MTFWPAYTELGLELLEFIVPFEFFLAILLWLQNLWKEGTPDRYNKLNTPVFIIGNVARSHASDVRVAVKSQC
jgi:hypothetical protein